MGRDGNYKKKEGLEALGLGAKTGSYDTTRLSRGRDMGGRDNHCLAQAARDSIFT